MAKRIIVLLDDEIDKKLRDKQAVIIRKSTSFVIFSKIINETLRRSI